VRFTAPSDVPAPGARLVQIQIQIQGAFIDSVGRFSIHSDSGYNFPSRNVIDEREALIPRSTGRYIINCEYTTFNIYLTPGEFYWFVVSGNSQAENDGFKWLNSPAGVAWQAFKHVSGSQSWLWGRSTTALNIFINIQ
jgi:hypothetical protein